MEFLVNFLIGAGIMYLILGLVWSIFFTGHYVVKAIEWHHAFPEGKPFDRWSFLGLVALFAISWIAWPWSVKHNLPYLIP